MSTISEIKKSILADDVIDDVEAKQLRVLLYAEGKIDKEEAELLFALNNAVLGKDNHHSWETLFIEAIRSSLLKIKLHQAKLTMKKKNGFSLKYKAMESWPKQKRLC